MALDKIKAFLNQKIEDFVNPSQNGSVANKFWQGPVGNALANYQQSNIGQAHVDAGNNLSNILFKNPVEFGKQMASDVSDINKIRLGQSVEPRADRFGSLKDQATRTLGTGSFIAGAGNPVGVGAFTGLTGAINYGVNRLSGQQSGEALNNAAAETLRFAPKAFQMAGVSKLTDPLMGKIGGKFALPLKSGANIAQGMLMNKSAGYENTPTSIAIDAVFPVAGALTSKIFKSADEAARAVESQVTQALGKRLRNKKGAYTTVEKYIKRTRPYFRRGAGGFLGFRLEQDEDGNYKVGFDEKSALAGMALMMGGTKALDVGEQALKNASGEPIDRAVQEGVSGKAGKIIDQVSQQGRKADSSTPQTTQVPMRNQELQQGVAELKPTNTSSPASFPASQISKTEVGSTQQFPESTQVDSYDANIPQSKYAFNINKDNLNLTGKEKEVFDQQVNPIKPELEKIKGKTLSHTEVKEASKRANLLNQVVSRDDTLKAEAETLATRNRIVELDKKIASANPVDAKAEIDELLNHTRTVSSTMSDWGRKLESLKNKADESTRVQILRDVAKVEQDNQKIINEYGKVDWNNAESITKFYRQFVKPSAWEILDEYRYNNMLSNPKTHARNLLGNLQQTFITRPLTLTAEGKPVEAYKYLKGSLTSFPDAVESFVKSFKGADFVEKPDLNKMSTGKLPKLMTVPTRAMEAADQFFSTLIKGGETARGATSQQAEDTAAYLLFRSDTGGKGQGYLLNSIDKLTDWTYKAPKAVRWFVPFIRTPMNVAKQWVEFSPAGIATLPGASNKREQIAKALIGSVVTAMGASVAAQDRTTWKAPTDTKEKELFYAAGKKPFSVLIGDKWVPMANLGVYQFAFALPAAVKYYQEDSRTALTDSQVDAMVKATTGMAELLSGQTFTEGLGNFVKLVSGDADYSLPGNIAQAGTQVIPGAGLLRYITNIVDPIYRKPGGESMGEKVVNNVETGIPGLSKQLEPYTDPLGKPSERLPINQFMPYDVGQRNTNYEGMLDARTKKLQENAVDAQLEKKLKSGEMPEDGSIKESSNGTRYSIRGDKLKYIDEEGSVKNIDLKLQLDPPKLTGNTELNKTMISAFKSSLTSQKKDVVKLYELGILDEKQAGEIINKLQSVYDSQPKISSGGGGKVSLRKVAPAKVTSLKAKTTPRISLKAVNLSKSRSSGTVKLSSRQKRATPKVSEAQLARLRKPNLKS